MVHRSNVLKLALALVVLFLAVAGASSLVATEMEVTEATVLPAIEGCDAPAELTTEEVTFPLTPWFAESNFLPGDLNIECIPGASCWEDWHCGGGNRGYCNIGSCVCL